VSHTGLAEVRYGTWTQRNGITHSKIQGVTDLSVHERSLPSLIDALEMYANQTPFPAIDHFEFWLLDEKHCRPLVLLDTATHQGDVNPQHYAGEWRPSQSVAVSFRSEHGSFDDLLMLVNQAAGDKHQAAWYQRDAEGNGKGLDGETRSASDFPTLQIRTDYFDEKENMIIHDYIYWDAPALLQLHGLSHEQRQQLETYAWQQPLRVEQLHCLYPQIIDQDGLEVALVKARLIGKNENPDGWQEPFLPFVSE
ncbi:MAG: hypothetical protein OQL16_13660, partial [Gammaproteobacteria bacterium]|nr:hypothetical protein [Gammaproteobacteria bacterium]